MTVLPPLLDLLGVGVFSQTLCDVISDFDQALSRVFQLLSLGQTLLWTVQLLQCCLHGPHALLTLTNRHTHDSVQYNHPHQNHSHNGTSASVLKLEFRRACQTNRCMAHHTEGFLVQLFRLLRQMNGISSRGRVHGGVALLLPHFCLHLYSLRTQSTALSNSCTCWTNTSWIQR